MIVYALLSITICYTIMSRVMTFKNLKKYKKDHLKLGDIWY